ncbi:MAG: hypothetical protein Q4G55_08540 [bacterium]|nr:hypothetical protein [bacterium]
MNLYDIEEVKRSVTCEDYLARKGIRVESHRCAATWRGGDGMNVSLDGATFYDHKLKQGGSVIDLCHCVEGGTSGAARGVEVSRCASILGDLFGLAPKSRTLRRAYDYRTSPHYVRDVNEGYAEKAKYVYTDAGGAPLHLVIRMEHPARPKDFIQCTPYSGSLKGVETVLYNLPAVLAAQQVVVVEGEKDADTLNRLGFCATTCNNGADHWRDAYTETLRGKRVVVCRDNDQAGLDHAHLVLRSLADAAAELRLVCPSALPKGDVTDWIEREGGTREKFAALCDAARALSPEEARWSDEKLALYTAKRLNEKPLRNYSVETVKRRRRGGGEPEESEVLVPRAASEMVDELHARFLGFPMLLGESTLFDFDRRRNAVAKIGSTAQLFAWISEKSGRQPLWERGRGMMTKDEFFCASMRMARQYQKIAKVPSWPISEDVYYACSVVPKPTKGHEAFRRYMRFFHAEDDNSLVLMSAFVASLMYYRPGIQRPCWIVDSRHGQSAGKTTFVETACELYDFTPIRTSALQLERNELDLNKRLVSESGRSSRVLLLDNLRGVFDNPVFADLVTASSISGRAPYGMGEETRPNDLTYVITSNSANVGADMASRSVLIYVRPPAVLTGRWKEEVVEFIRRRRMDILWDVWDILNSSKPPQDFRASTRFPEWESEVLWKMCGSAERYAEVVRYIASSRADANVDDERAKESVEIIKSNLQALFDSCRMANAPVFTVENCMFFIRTKALNLWLKTVGIDAQDLRNYMNVGMEACSCLCRDVKFYPRNHKSIHCQRGVMFIGSDVRTNLVRIVTVRGDKDACFVRKLDGAVETFADDRMYEYARACAARAKVGENGDVETYAPAQTRLVPSTPLSAPGEVTVAGAAATDPFGDEPIETQIAMMEGR